MFVRLVSLPCADNLSCPFSVSLFQRFILHAKKTAFIMEHDFIMATYLADKVIVYTGVPAVDCTCNAPQSLLTGMNSFLADIKTTFRRDPTNHRPRINKENSLKDREQKAARTYFYLDTDDELGDEPLQTKADKKKKDKAAAADAKDMARETKKMQDAEKAEAARLAKEDAEDGK